jgi:hypothetical protein
VRCVVAAPAFQIFECLDVNNDGFMTRPEITGLFNAVDGLAEQGLPTAAIAGGSGEISNAGPALWNATPKADAAALAVA